MNNSDQMRKLMEALDKIEEAGDSRHESEDALEQAIIRPKESIR